MGEKLIDDWLRESEDGLGIIKEDGSIDVFNLKSNRKPTKKEKELFNKIFDSLEETEL